MQYGCVRYHITNTRYVCCVCVCEKRYELDIFVSARKGMHHIQVRRT